MYGKARQLPKFKESYWLLLIRVMGNVRSGWGKFHSKINCHVPCKKGEVTKERSATGKGDGDIQR